VIKESRSGMSKSSKPSQWMSLLVFDYLKMGPSQTRSTTRANRGDKKIFTVGKI